MSKNEATFEAILDGLLRKLFPENAIQVEHQISFTVCLGRQYIKVGGRKGWAKGRLDVLLSADSRHVAVLELKRPGLGLTDADRDQGLSYARLLQPMAPLVIVSNGEHTSFFQTLDGAIWNPTSLSEQAFASLVAQAAQVAGKERDSAIRAVFGADASVWAEYLRAHSQETLRERTGTLAEFGYPFVEGYSIPRNETSAILSELQGDCEVIALVGPPLSGKSNVLKQCCDAMVDGDLVPLYTDASATRQGPLGLLASIFVQNLFGATSRDEVRQWLSTSLRSLPDDSRLVIFLDELGPVFEDAWMADMDELLGIAKRAPLSLVLALDSQAWTILRNRPGRTTLSELGRRARVINLDLLDEQGFRTGVEQSVKVARCAPYRGAEYNVDYREPRLLRVLAAAASESVRSGVPSRQDTLLVVPSVTTAPQFRLAWDAYVRENHDLVRDLRKLARAFFDDVASRTERPDLQLASYHTAALRTDVAERSLGETTLARLRERGFVSTRLGRNQESLLLPNPIELFARAASLELCTIVEDCVDLDGAYSTLMSLSDSMPLGDIVGADALAMFCEDRPEFASSLVHRAVLDSPEICELPAGSIIEVSRFGKPVGALETPERSTLTGNLHPWLVLAQFACFPLGDNAGRSSPNGWILANVGSFPGFLRRGGNGRSLEIEGFHFHDLQGGTVTCQNMGIVEPLGMAMVNNFHMRPEEMLSMAEHAVDEERGHLVWRLNVVAHELESATNARVSEAATEVHNMTDKYIHEKLIRALGHDVLTSEPKAKSTNQLRNEKKRRRRARRGKGRKRRR